MTPDQILIWVQAGRLLVGAGVATVEDIKAWVASKHGQTMTEADMDAILDAVIADATRRKALADADAVQAAIDAGRS
jgi:hypothetical protein